MNFGGTIRIKGKDALWQIDGGKDGTVDLVFKNDRGDAFDDELILKLDLTCFHTLCEMVREFKIGERVINKSVGGGEIECRQFFHFNGDPLGVRSEFDDALECTPTIQVRTKGLELGLCFDLEQLGAIEDTCRRIRGVFAEVKSLEESGEAQTVTQ